MDAKVGAAANDMNNFEPSFDLIQEEECDTLLVYLPGFTKEQLRVQLARSGILKVSGTRLLGDNKWSSFQKDFPVSANCDTNKISAKFEGGILYLRQPKLIVPAKKEHQISPPLETPQPQTPAKEPPPAPKTDQEQATIQKTTPTDDQNKQTSAKDFPERTAEEHEEKSTKEKEKSSESKDAKKDERNNVQEKADSIDDDKKDAATSTDGKHEKLSGNVDAKLANKGSNLNATAKVDNSKLFEGSPAAKLKMARQQTTMILAVLFAFALGMYISNLGWFSRKAEN